MTTAAEHPVPGDPAVAPRPARELARGPVGDVTVTRTPAGWAVIAPTGVDGVAELVEGLTLADLITEELGGSVDPERAARRSARGPAAAGAPDEDPVAARIAALERTVAQLEHALAARVTTERAIGVLAERHGTCPREAFESIRRAARSQGRPVAELAREVLDQLPGADPAPGSAGATS